MRSLQVKFSALVVTLLVVASVGLAFIATQHERRALEAEVEKRGRALVVNLAGAAKEPLLEADQGDFDRELLLERLIREVGATEGVVAVRLLGRSGTVVASLDPAERGASGIPRMDPSDADAGPVQVSREGPRMRLSTPISYSDVWVGQAQIELDLRILVDPVVRSSTRQLAAVAVLVTVLGVFAGVGFVALLVGPLRRLRVGVERLAAGDVSVRVAPTSRDEVGELTRAFNEMGDSLEQKERIQRAFGRYVDDYVLNQLLETSEGVKQAGIEREVTILFADIRQFTRLSEGMEAQDVVALLNEVFQLISDVILARGGTIDKFIGDSVMAYFGAPVPHTDHALRAVTAAVEIARSIERRNKHVRAFERGGSNRVPVAIGIGIHAGVVVVGNIGSDRRTDFTAIGDAVNVAHRLEKLAEPGQILVSEAVQRRVRGAARLRFEGERHLSGREEPVHVYAVEIDTPRSKTAEGDAPAGA
ncbi:MAG: HAMP domain-containing protein [Myxococcales bacterium]|nr:HAMP domain-containing protein [Myxococcales bacterium]MDH5307621.1 HAMP domain-containing protein [Myxococcales bacterium]MDH5566158.1 HAMP domain-containing protein [Myxococcales bacterium]